MTSPLRQPLQMIVCDWNGTLFRDRLEETFFFGLCQRAVKRSLTRFDLVALTKLGICGIRCFMHYLASKRHPGRVPYHVSQIIRLLNRNVLCGVGRDELDAYTGRYGRLNQGKLDRRLLDPIVALRAKTPVTLGIISSGCLEGITAVLAEAAVECDFIVANKFNMAGDVTESFDFAMADHKHEALVRILKERNVPPSSVMFIGDSPQDEHCLSEVGYPVVSLFANNVQRQQLAEKCGAFVPTNQADFSRHLDQSLKG